MLLAFPGWDMPGCPGLESQLSQSLHVRLEPRKPENWRIPTDLELALRQGTLANRRMCWSEPGDQEAVTLILINPWRVKTLPLFYL